MALSRYVWHSFYPVVSRMLLHVAAMVKVVICISESQPNGQGNRLVQEFEPSAAEDLPCRKGRCTLNRSRLKCPPVGVAWKLKEGRASSLDPGSKLRGSPGVAQ
ncbi:hypothetical protein TNCV_865321 [Trichonephila clavipes]|nr:hypothetical protein TNCV_865321 [Trichonephila clavipes]